MIIKTYEKFFDFFKKKNIISDELSDELHFPTGLRCEIDDIPPIGSYVILNVSYSFGHTHPIIFKNKIGIVKELITWNPAHSGVLIKIYFEENDISEDAYSQEFECWSKNKKTIEAYLDSKKYNL